MIIDAAWKALNRLLTPQFRTVFWKTLGVTLLLLVGLWVAIRQVFFSFAWPWMEQLLPGMPQWAGWLGIVAAIVAGLGLALVLALMIAPVTALIAGFSLMMSRKSWNAKTILPIRPARRCRSDAPSSLR
ncbi:hypothetical protein V568_102028 [Brucella ceti TE28753-12]|nr:hypothetical protein V910_101807 [Brucella ceti TE10759-12]AHB02632.1 hypothetical protein V568_102028 [Brucella ceti TE28753-12]ENR13097.1 hypothetical protein C068_00044 [Brucella sp. UK38/05]ENT12066.1 hypothetical protein C001_00467 [Brucella sp. F5/06]